MWEQLVRDRGGLPLAELGVADFGSAAFACVEIADDGLLPLIARLQAEPPAFLIKSGRVGGAESERGSLPITEVDVAAALDRALADDAEWERDPDLGIELLVSEVPGVAEGLLIPRFLYRRHERVYEYAAAVPEASRQLGDRLQRLVEAAAGDAADAR